MRERAGGVCWGSCDAARLVLEVAALVHPLHRELPLLAQQQHRRCRQRDPKLLVDRGGVVGDLLLEGALADTVRRHLRVRVQRCLHHLHVAERGHEECQEVGVRHKDEDAVGADLGAELGHAQPHRHPPRPFNCTSCVLEASSHIPWARLRQLRGIKACKLRLYFLRAHRPPGDLRECRSVRVTPPINAINATYFTKFTSHFDDWHVQSFCNSLGSLTGSHHGGADHLDRIYSCFFTQLAAVLFKLLQLTLAFG
mmetsp:Transcript_4431/g.8900  ORF Transcript_4431/g.8900 Transcript_4431/m.8900 type:complete len:254 (-) Transcript_4431:224-985(-)